MDEMTMNEVTFDEVSMDDTAVEVVPEESVEMINDEKSGFNPAIVVGAAAIIGGLAVAGVKKLRDKHKSAEGEKPKTKKKISFRLPIVITEQADPEVELEEEISEVIESIKEESEAKE